VRELLDVASSAIPTFETIGDHRALGRAFLHIGFTKGNFQLQFAALEDAAEKAAYHYRVAGWSASTPLGGLMNALYYGPRPVGEAIARCEQLLQEHAGDRGSEANVLQWMGGLEAMQGRFDAARAHIGRAKTLYEGLGLQLSASDGCVMVLAEVELLAGRVEVAAQRLREACDTCIRLNESSYLASRAAQLADALYSLTQYDEAQTWTEVSRERADSEDLHAQASWRSIASCLAARQGDVGVALRLIEEAGDILEQGDGLNQRAKLQLDLAEVYKLCDRNTEARRAVRRAVELYEAKGNEVAAGSARGLLEKFALV
jgi:tetratricopeptide (TPR) repeat protein